jgi:uncharacterized protein (DUF1800 family)
MRASLPVLGCVLLLSACAHSMRPGPQSAPLVSPAPLASLSHQDLQWLERTSFGLTESLLADYRRLGRAAFLEQQLSAAEAPLPSAVAAQIAQLQVGRIDPERALGALQSQRRAIAALAPEQQARERLQLNELGNQLAGEAISRELLRAIYSPAQLREQLVWFWLNHFSVFQGKAELRYLVGDYAEHAIRPYALGHFQDLLLATLQHPAMLQYLDNRQNRRGHVNENYAREFLELHTLGVEGGYSQQDVQQLALIFTGVGINLGPPPRLPRSLLALYVRHGVFEFNPAQHDMSHKRLLGHRIRGAGFDEVRNAVRLIVQQPACARFISRQLATYFVADAPPEALVERMAQTFQRTDGDIAAVLRTLFLARELDQALGSKFKDPMRYVVSGLRLVEGDRVIANTTPIINWLRLLGELPFGRLTPDGYPLTQAAWDSPGQLAARFEVARALGAGAAPLFLADDAAAAASRSGALAASALYAQSLAPYLASNTQQVLARARSRQEWNRLLLSSPDFNYE